MIPEDAIRQRSYEIWQREGCPSGKHVEHWLLAKAELEAEFRMMAGKRDQCQIVLPRLPISRPPSRLTARRVSRTTVTAAKG